MWTLRAGLQILWWSLFTVVALVWLPNAPPKVAVDRIPIAIVGSDGVKALAVAPVLLMADGILPWSTLTERRQSFLDDSHHDNCLAK
jgi:hypothetical protein